MIGMEQEKYNGFGQPRGDLNKDNLVTYQGGFNIGSPARPCYDDFSLRKRKKDLSSRTDSSISENLCNFFSGLFK